MGGHTESYLPAAHEAIGTQWVCITYATCIAALAGAACPVEQQHCPFPGVPVFSASSAVLHLGTDRPSVDCAGIAASGSLSLYGLVLGAKRSVFVADIRRRCGGSSGGPLVSSPRKSASVHGCRRCGGHSPVGLLPGGGRHARRHARRRRHRRPAVYELVRTKLRPALVVSSRCVRSTRGVLHPRTSAITADMSDCLQINRLLICTFACVDQLQR